MTSCESLTCTVFLKSKIFKFKFHTYSQKQKQYINNAFTKSIVWGCGSCFHIFPLQSTHHRSISLLISFTSSFSSCPFLLVLSVFIVFFWQIPQLFSSLEIQEHSKVKLVYSFKDGCTDRVNPLQSQCCILISLLKNVSLCSWTFDAICVKTLTMIVKSYNFKTLK